MNSTTLLRYFFWIFNASWHAFLASKFPVMSPKIWKKYIPQLDECWCTHVHTKRRGRGRPWQHHPDPWPPSKVSYSWSQEHLLQEKQQAHYVGPTVQTSHFFSQTFHTALAACHLVYMHHCYLNLTHRLKRCLGCIPWPTSAETNLSYILI